MKEGTRRKNLRKRKIDAEVIVVKTHENNTWQGRNEIDTKNLDGEGDLPNVNQER